MKKLVLCGMFIGALTALAAPNLLQNGDFKVSTVAWSNRSKPSQNVEVVDSPHGKAMKVTIDSPKKGDHGQIIQVRQNVKPNAKYRISAWIKAPSDTAYVQTKLMQGRKEGKRQSSGTNKGDDWTQVASEVTTAEGTTGIQVLLRFRMNEGLKNKSIEFADIRLEGVSGGAENDVAPEPAKMPKPAEAVKDVVAEPGENATVHPGDSGKKIQDALSKLGPGNVLTIAAGEYSGDWKLHLAAGGTKDKPIVIRGEVKDGKRPVITGSWKRSKPAGGSAFLELYPGTGYVTIENLDLRNFNSALHARGPNNGVKVTKVDLTYCRDGYVLDGGMVPGIANSGSGGFEMTDCKILFHTKKGVRTMNGFHDAKFVRCKADAGGKEFANAEPRDIFSSGFHVLGSYRGKGGRKVDHHITFIDCEANNNYYDPSPKNYWNADGFCSEEASEDIAFIRCKASGNTDGGWDIKSTRPKFIDCTGDGNKRNFRVWLKKGQEAVFENCVSANSWNVGKSDHYVGFWMLGGGNALFTGCTSKNDDRPFSVEAHSKDGEPVQTLIKIRNCKVEPANAKPFYRRDGEVKIDTDGSVKAD